MDPVDIARSISGDILVRLLIEQVEVPNYPEHPDTVLIKNEFYPYGLSEHMVWKHVENHKKDFLKQLDGRKVLLIIKTDGGPVLRRKDGDREYEIKSKGDIEELNSGRVMEFHIVAGKETDVAWVDLDPKDDFDFDEALEIARELVPVLSDVTGSKDVVLKYSGGRGFHLINWLNSSVGVDDLRKSIIGELKNYIGGNGKLSTDIVRKSDMMRLDVSTLHDSGSIRAAWSFNVSTGLVSVPIEGDGSFSKKDASIVIPRKLIFYPFKEDPNSTSGQMRKRVRDPKSFIDESFKTWKYWGDVKPEEGLSYIVGKLVRPFGEETVQAIRFNRGQWSAEKAGKWWEENYYKFDVLWSDKDWVKRR